MGWGAAFQGRLSRGSTTRNPGLRPSERTASGGSNTGPAPACFGHGWNSLAQSRRPQAPPLYLLQSSVNAASTLPCRRPPAPKQRHASFAAPDPTLNARPPTHPPTRRSQRYASVLGDSLGDTVGRTLVDLDGRFEAVRSRETALGNFVCDVWRASCARARVQVVLCNSGTLRSDAVHAAGDLTNRDLMAMLPMLDATVVLDAPGGALLEALENGVSLYPRLEGRFLQARGRGGKRRGAGEGRAGGQPQGRAPAAAAGAGRRLKAAARLLLTGPAQVSGISFTFDPSLPPGQRVVPGSVRVGDAPLDEAAT